MTRQEIKKVNSKLREFNSYFNQIPLDKISEALKLFGLKLLQEDGTEFSGIFCGNNSYTTIDVGNDYEIFKNTSLFISWYKMESGRYEIVTYLT